MCSFCLTITNKEVNMVQKFELKDFPNLESLHDCETSAIEYIDKKLIFYFEKEGLNIFTSEGNKKYPNNKLIITYILNANFIDEDFFCAVRKLNQKKILRKNAIGFCTLKRLVDNLNKTKCNLRLYGQYFNYRNCILIAELIKNNKWQMGNEFNIELLVDEVIYEWIE